MSRLLHSFILFVCLAVAGCAIPVDLPPGETATLREYFWDGNGELRYDVYMGADSVPVEHTVTLTSSGDTIRALDVSYGKTGRIVTRAFGNSVMLVEVDGSALFPLPQGAYISKYAQEQKIKQYFGVANFAYWPSGAVAFTTGGWFYSIDKTTWQRSNSNFDGVVTAVKWIEKTGVRLYAGTAAGALYLSEDGGKNWILKTALLKGAVRSLEIAENGYIYLAVEGRGAFVYKEGQSVQLGEPIPEITGMVMMTGANAQHYLVASTAKNGLLKMEIAGTNAWQPYQSSLGVQSFTGIYGQAGKFVTTASGGVYYTLTDTSEIWTRSILPLAGLGEEISCVSVDADGVALATTIGRLFHRTWKDDNPGVISNVESGIKAVAIRDDGFYTASSLGLHRLSRTSEPEQMGPFTVRIDSARGELTLLHSDFVELIEGSSWPAGTLYIPASPLSPYVPITARVMERLDTLRADNESYADVFPVRYAFENASGLPYDLSPYWVIYYARHIGPVMIDRIDNSMSVGAPNSRAIYKRRR
jgi:hypothetical protein